MDFDEYYDLSNVPADKLDFTWRAVNTRRLQWDNLLWQIPLLSITGEAFLFSIILGSTTPYFSRNLSSVLAMIISAASLQLFARQRASEMHDAHLIEAIEKRMLGYSIHGERFVTSKEEFVKNELRKKHPNSVFDYLVQKLNSRRSYPIWMIVYLAFLLSAALCLVLNIFHCGIFF